MNAKQYTLRNVHPKIDSLVRSRARRSGQSMNDVVLDALQIGLGLNPDELLSPSSSLKGLAVFDAAAKKPSPFSPDKSVKELYYESIQKKYAR